MPNCPCTRSLCSAYSALRPVLPPAAAPWPRQLHHSTRNHVVPLSATLPAPLFHVVPLKRLLFLPTFCTSEDCENSTASRCELAAAVAPLDWTHVVPLFDCSPRSSLSLRPLLTHRKKHTSSNGRVANRDGMGHRGARSGHYSFQLSAPLKIAKTVQRVVVSHDHEARSPETLSYDVQPHIMRIVIAQIDSSFRRHALRIHILACPRPVR